MGWVALSKVRRAGEAGTGLEVGILQQPPSGKHWYHDFFSNPGKYRHSHPSIFIEMRKLSDANVHITPPPAENFPMQCGSLSAQKTPSKLPLPRQFSTLFLFNHKTLEEERRPPMAVLDHTDVNSENRGDRLRMNVSQPFTHPAAAASASADEHLHTRLFSCIVVSPVSSWPTTICGPRDHAHVLPYSR